jgi:hypothetical protein
MTKNRKNKNDPALDRLLATVWTALDACDKCLEGHEHGRCLDTCLYEDVQGLRYNLQSAECAISSSMLVTPAMQARYSREAGHHRAAVA